MEDYPVEEFKRAYDSHIQEAHNKKELAFPHLHTLCEILYCYDGGLDVQIGTQWYSFMPGDLILIPANTVHSVHAVRSDHSRYAVVQFNPSFLANPKIPNEQKCMAPFSSDHLTVQKRIPAAIVRNSEIPKLIEKILENRDGRRFAKDLYAKEYYCALTTWILEKLGYCDEEAEIGNSQDILKIEPALRYIEENYRHELSVAALADLCSYSYAYFSKLFLKTLLVSPSAYLSAVRITKSRDLLEKTDTQITDIASAVGFNDVSHFIRTFKKTVGMSPLKYRNLAKEQDNGGTK